MRKGAKPIYSGSYDIRSYYHENILRDFCKNPSNKKLAQKAVPNYTKSDNGDLSDTDQ